MTSELETGIPSVHQIQDLIKAGSEIEVKLVTNDLLVGKLRWQDNQCVCLLDQYDQPTIIWKQALVYVKPKS